MKKIICFGEVLWDVFPSYKRIGGAPLNVAVRLQSLDNNVAIISRIGVDSEGEEILNFLKEKGIITRYIQKDTAHKTGSVSVLLDKEGAASYTIDFPRAWDYIALKKEIKEEITTSDAFIFGSLASRNQLSQDTLFALLKYASYKVFDVNLRAPFFTKDLLIQLMEKADFIKFNEEELLQTARYLKSENTAIEENIRFVSKATQTPHICVTKGKDGAILLYNDRLYFQKGYKVGVVNTVGAGDSFLASLIHYLLKGESPQYSIAFACAVGSLVTQSQGANPKLSINEIHKMLKS